MRTASSSAGMTNRTQGGPGTRASGSVTIERGRHEDGDRRGPARLEREGSPSCGRDQPPRRLAQVRPGAHQVESRAPGAREVARSRHELAGIDPADRGRELCFENGQLHAVEAGGRRPRRAVRGSGRRPRPRRRPPGSTRAHRRGAAAGSRPRRSPRASLRPGYSSCSRGRVRFGPARQSTSSRPWSSTPSCSNANGRSGAAPSSVAIRAASSDSQ